MKKRLYRSKKDLKIAGVCSGIGDYCNVDPIIIRLVFLATCANDNLLFQVQHKSGVKNLLNSRFQLSYLQL